MGKATPKCALLDHTETTGRERQRFGWQLMIAMALPEQKRRSPMSRLQMKIDWNALFGLDEECSIWVQQEDLGKEKDITFNERKHRVTIPRKIEKKVTLRLRGRGKIRGNRSGDLFLHIWLNKGEDIQRTLWLSETSARNGADKRLFLEDKAVTMVVPPKSYHGLTIRLRGFGKPLEFNWRAPFLRRKSGNALVRLSVYPDQVTPKYGSFDMLDTDTMALEGWVYRKVDEVIQKVGRSSFPIRPLGAETVADLFNEYGWKAIFQALVRHLNLTHVNLQVAASASMSVPGSCQQTLLVQENIPVGCKYDITIHERFLKDPFSIAAILAHELCHVLYAERLNDTPRAPGARLRTEKDTLEEERTVDLLVFMYRIGEFQLRVAREDCLTLGYFNQEIFERMQVIVSRKLGGTEKR